MLVLKLGDLVGLERDTVSHGAKLSILNINDRRINCHRQYQQLKDREIRWYSALLQSIKYSVIQTKLVSNYLTQKR